MKLNLKMDCIIHDLALSIVIENCSFLSGLCVEFSTVNKAWPVFLFIMDYL